MKKFNFISLLIICILLVGCTTNIEKVPTDLNNFNTIVTKNSYTFEDTSELYGSYDYIENAAKGTLNDAKIELITYKDADSAEEVLKNHMDSFKLLKSTGAMEINETGKNYHKYSLVSNNYYMISVRVENTLIYCKTSLTNKDSVEKIFNELGY